MLAYKEAVRQALHQVAEQRYAQGADLDLDELAARIDAAADSYDALVAIGDALRQPPTRADWPYVEPVLWDDIVAESPDLNPSRPMPAGAQDGAAERVATAFVSSVCGCVLGKPVEVNPTLAELRRAGEATGEWPVTDYFTEAFVDALGRHHNSRPITTRENITFAADDDDIHYTMIGMLALERGGRAFSHADLLEIWSTNLPWATCWGPERTMLALHGVNGLNSLKVERDFFNDVFFLNPGDELCGAMIRADAYGYACPGNPGLAAWLAWKDASFTHIKTGAYATMYAAALIALCHTADPALSGNDRVDIAAEALKCIPAVSRFAHIVRDSIDKVRAAATWLEGYAAIHGKYAEYAHCRVYQETGTLINTLKFAEDIGHGFCIQVSQGNDTDSYGATSGSMLGCFFGPGHLDERWTRPFNDRLNHALAQVHEYSLSRLAARMAKLPTIIAG